MPARRSTSSAASTSASPSPGKRARGGGGGGGGGGENPWLDKDVVSTDPVTREALQVLYDLADEFKAAVETKKPLQHVLAGRVVALCFLEPSTRTCTSFSAAVQRLGGSVVQVNASESSVAKGESLADTVRTLESYADAVVLRHAKLGSAAEAAAVMRKPLINAGDGVGEHPTQALLDLYTILREPLSSAVLDAVAKAPESVSTPAATPRPPATYAACLVAVPRIRSRVVRCLILSSGVRAPCTPSFPVAYTR